MSDRSELALQLTDAVAATQAAVQRAGDRAFRAYGLSHRAHAALNAVDGSGPDGARPEDWRRPVDAVSPCWALAAPPSRPRRAPCARPRASWSRPARACRRTAVSLPSETRALVCGRGTILRSWPPRRRFGATRRGCSD